MAIHCNFLATAGSVQALGHFPRNDVKEVRHMSGDITLDQNIVPQKHMLVIDKYLGVIVGLNQS